MGIVDKWKPVFPSHDHEPTVTIYSTNTGATGNAYNATGAADVAASSTNIGTTGFHLSTIPTDANLYLYHWVADAEI